MGGEGGEGVRRWGVADGLEAHRVGDGGSDLSWMFPTLLVGSLGYGFTGIDSKSEDVVPQSRPLQELANFLAAKVRLARSFGRTASVRRICSQILKCNHARTFIRTVPYASFFLKILDVRDNVLGAFIFMLDYRISMPPNARSNSSPSELLSTFDTPLDSPNFAVC